MSLFDAGQIPALDSNGNPIVGAKWFFYDSGTLNPRAVYSDAANAVALGSSITADGSGRFPNAYLDDADGYRAIMKDAGGIQIKDIDPVWTTASTDFTDTYVLAAMFREDTDGGDDALAVQRAIDAVYAAGGGTVLIYSGAYTWLTAVAMKSGVTVEAANALIDVNDAPSPAITFDGTVGTEFPITVNVTNGDTVLTFGSDPGFASGDLVHIVSQRNALSRADSGSWWLGDGTASLNYAYFAEFSPVRDRPTTTTLTLSSPLLFPNYRTSSAAETETQRGGTTVKKVTPCLNAHWVGGIFVRNVSGGSLHSGTWASDCTFKPDRIERGRVMGTSSVWNASLRCESSALHNNDPTLVWDYNTYHAQLNRFKIVGCQDCGVDGVRESFGAQSVDFTYGPAALFTNVRPYCKNGFFYNCFEGLTSHAGAYRETWEANDVFAAFDDALVVRGYEPTITNNRFYGTVDTTDGVVATKTFGVVLAFGGPRRAVVRGNTCRGFYGFIDIRDSGGAADLAWGNVIANISDNEVSHCFSGLDTTFNTYGEWAVTTAYILDQKVTKGGNIYVVTTAGTSAGAGGPSGTGTGIADGTVVWDYFGPSYKDSHRFITYANNRHSFMGRCVAELSQYSAGVTITGNTWDGGSRYSGVGAFVAYVYALANCPGLVVTGNNWRRTLGGDSGYTKYLVTAGSVTDTTAFPKATWAAQAEVENNSVDYADIDGVITASFGSINYVQTKYAEPASADYTIAGGLVEILPTSTRSFYMNVDTEGAAASDDLDRITPYTNTAFREGDVVYLRSVSSARDIVLRDVTTSGAATYGIQTPGNASITLNTSNDIACLLYNGTHWSLFASTSTL